MSQQFGGNPPSLKWRQINTDTVRVIFPAGLEKQAMDVAALVQELSTTSQSTIGSRLRKVNIVLQNQTTTSNGYVSLAPFRSEFFLTPEQNSFDLGSLPWHKTLALHEYRHVQQFNNFRKGLSKAFYIVFGEEGQALANNLVIPDWFWEGDAVYQETLLSNQGRGRLPSFFNGYRSLWAGGKDYSWMKLRNGSYRDYIPDHYHLGFMMVAYGREKYGDSIWRKVTNDAARFRGVFYPLQKSIKRNTGIAYSDFRSQAISYFKSPVIKNTNDVPSTYAKANPHFVGDREHPQWIDENHLIYVKSSYKKIPAFYVNDLQTGAEKKIRTKDFSVENYFSYRNNKVVYASLRADARWGWRNYGVIKVLDLRNGVERKLTNKTKYFSPDIDEEGNKIVAVQINPSGKTSVDIVDANSGTLISRMPNQQNLVYTYPKFYSKTKILSAVRDQQGDMALGLFDINSGIAEWLVPFSTRTIAFPQVNKDTVSFSMTDGKRDKMYAFAAGTLFELVPTDPNITTSDYQPSLYAGRFAWTSFTAVGYQLRTATVTMEKIALQSTQSPNTVYELPHLQGKKNFVADTSLRRFPVLKYPSLFKPFNFHSWRPYISDPEYSYSLISENILNTLQSEIDLTYNRNEGFTQTGASLAYAGWYPVLQAGASYTFNRKFTDPTVNITWNEFNASAGTYVPLSFSGNSYFQSIVPSVTINNKQVLYTGESKRNFSNKQFTYGEYGISASNQQLKARQNIYPHFAQTFFARYRSILTKYTAWQMLIDGALYFPGISVNHSIVLQAALQQRDTMQQYNFSNSFPISRGYSNIDFPRMWKFGANYHLPIAYPDAGFGNIIYLLRVRGNAYYDYTEVMSLRTGRHFEFRSAGAEIYFDTRWWNELPLSFGIRYSRLLDADPAGRSPNQWQLVLPLNLLSR